MVPCYKVEDHLLSQCTEYYIFITLPLHKWIPSTAILTLTEGCHSIPQTTITGKFHKIDTDNSVINSNCNICRQYEWFEEQESIDLS